MKNKLKMVSVFAVLFTLSCSTDKSDLDRWYAEGDVHKISKHVSENIRGKNVNKSVVYGIGLLGDAGADSTLRQFGSLIGEDISPEYTQALAEALKRQALVPKSPVPFCEMVTSGNHSQYDGMEKILASFRDPALSACVAKSLEDANISFDAEEVVNAIDQVDELTSDLPEALERIQSQAKILEYNRELENKIEDKERKISQVEDKISDEMKVIERTKILDAYVVGLVEKLEIGNLYEFAFTTFRNEPTKRHGYLLTTETSFKSSGLFEMRVKKMREVRTRLRREFGGFEQSWPLYAEVKGYEKSRKKVKKLKHKKRKLETEANRMKRFKNPRRNRTYSTKNSEKNRTENNLDKNIDILSRAFEHRYEKNTDKLEHTKVKKEVEKKTDNEEYETTGSVSPRGIAEEAEVHILRDTVTEKRLIAWARPKVTDTLSQSFNDSTAIGPFRRFEEEDGLLFKTADAKWRVLHFWSPSREVHAWRVTNRRTGETRKSDNSNQYSEIDSLLTSTSGLSRSQELEDHLWNGMDYSDARRVVLASGWMPTGDVNRSGFRAPRLAKEKNWREVRTCAGTGAAPCRFEFLSPVGNRLVLITAGESDDPGLESWAIE